MKYEEYDETSGEIAVGAVLKKMNIQFIPQYKIEGLTGDKKSFRIIDFWLHDYGIAVEFLGEWNNERERQRYEEKKRVYELNGIKCIWIYPDQLTHTHKVIQDGLLSFGVKSKAIRSAASREPFHVKTHLEFLDNPEIKDNRNSTSPLETYDTDVHHNWKPLLLLVIFLLTVYAFIWFTSYSDQKDYKIFDQIKIGATSSEVISLVSNLEKFHMDATTIMISDNFNENSWITVYFDAPYYIEPPIAQSFSPSDAQVIKVELSINNKFITSK